MVIMRNDIIDISFNINLFDLSVSVWLSKSDPGGNSIRIPGSEWYLEASTQNST